MNNNSFFVDNFYENASQFNWEQAADGALEIQPITDHARFSCNSQFTHWNFKFIVPESEIGKKQTVRFRPVRAYYNLEPNVSFQAEKMATSICYNLDCTDPEWERLEMKLSSVEGSLTEFTFVVQSTVTQIAHTPLIPCKIIMFLLKGFVSRSFQWRLLAKQPRGVLWK